MSEVEDQFGWSCVCFCWLCLLHPNRKPHWPAPGELRASPFRGRLRSARYALLRSAAPGRGAQVAKNTMTEQTLHRRRLVHTVLGATLTLRSLGYPLLLSRLRVTCRRSRGAKTRPRDPGHGIVCWKKQKPRGPRGSAAFFRTTNRPLRPSADGAT